MAQGVPESLHLAESLANSMDVETDWDDLASADKAEAWLAAHGMGEHTLAPADVQRLRAFRAGLRALLLANHGEPVDTAAVAAMNDAAMGTRLAVRFDDDGVPYLESQGSGLDHVFAEIQKGIANAVGEGTWERLKLCRNDGCAVAFYDQSKNRSRSWCSMEVCGNRMKARSFRKRQAEGD